MIDLQGKTPKNIQDTPVIKLNAPRSSNLRKYKKDILIGIICEASSNIQASFNYDKLGRGFRKIGEPGSKVKRLNIYAYMPYCE